MSFLFSLLTVCLLLVPNVSATSTDNLDPYQTAFVYFLPDYQPQELREVETRGCTKLGYTYTRINCASPRILKNKCPTGNRYKECFCAGSPTCTGSTSGSNPYSSSTGASSTSCTNCAGNTLYTWTCSSSACSSYTLSSCPSHGNCSGCCNGKYKLNSCQSGYHVSGNACEEDCNSRSSDWCDVHSTCHGDCCTDGTIEPCDTRCGGSGCSSSSSSSDSGGGDDSCSGGHIIAGKADCVKTCSCVSSGNSSYPYTMEINDDCSCQNGRTSWNNSYTSGLYGDVSLCESSISSQTGCNTGSMEWSTGTCGLYCTATGEWVD